MVVQGQEASLVAMSMMSPLRSIGYCFNKSFLLDYVPTNQQEADLMTKNLTVQKFQENRLWLNLKMFKS